MKGGPKMSNIGIITEQGDLGLGFDQLNKKDKKAYDNANQNKSKSNPANESKEK